MTKINLVRALSALCLLLPFSTTAQSAVTTLRYFHFGDVDEFNFSVPGAIATRSNDSASANYLFTHGAPLYTGEGSNEFSDRSILFDGATQGATTASPVALPADFGVEAWVKPTGTEGKRIIIYYGTPGVDGWGLIQQANGQFAAEFGGQIFFGQGAVEPETWTHLAFVVTGGTATFYLNGVPAGPSVVATPTAPGPGAEISIAATTGLRDLFAGQIDKVRIFTFEPGLFTPDLFFYNSPLVLTIVEDGVNATVSWPLDYPRYSLQTTTDLGTAWQAVSTPTRLNGKYQVTQPMRANQAIIPQRFFRLKTDLAVQADPKLQDGKFIVITSGGVPKNVTNLNAANVNRIINTLPSSIDARGFVDPADPNGNQVFPLQFHWVVRYPNQGGTYTAAGMKGYFNPVLTMIPGTLATQPSPPSVNGRGVAFTLEVFSANSGRTTTVIFQAQVVGSALSLSLYNDCQLETMACPTCICTIAAALPTDEPN